MFFQLRSEKDLTNEVIMGINGYKCIRKEVKRNEKVELVSSSDCRCDAVI